MESFFFCFLEGKEDNVLQEREGERRRKRVGLVSHEGWEEEI